MFCSNCGKKNPEGSKFCQHCGKKISEQNELKGLKEGKTKTGAHLLWKIPLSIIGFCVVAFMLLYAFSSSFRTGFNEGATGNTSTKNNVDNSNTSSTTDLNSWISYTPDSGQFTVMLPSYPLHKTDKDSSGNNYDNYTTSTDNETTGYFVEVYSVNVNTDLDTFLETTLNNMVQGVGGNAQIIYRNYSDIGANRALNFAVTFSNITLAGRIIVDSNTQTMYLLMDGYYSSTPDTNGLKKFLSSFQIN